MAYRQAELPYAAVAEPVARVTFPSFARMRAGGEDVMAPFLSTLRMVALVSLPLGVVLSAAAEPFTDALFGPKWPPMAGPLAVLGIWAVVRPLEVTGATLLNSVGHAGFVGRMSLALLVPQCVALAAAASAAGITAVAWVMLAHITVSLVVVAVMIQRVTGTATRTQWRALRPLAAAGAGSWLATRAVAEALSAAPPAVALAAAVAVDLAVYLVSVRLLAPGVLGAALRLAARALGRGGRPATEAVAAG
jgi:O-antigen/teichoic acid export membrane protein